MDEEQLKEMCTFHQMRLQQFVELVERTRQAQKDFREKKQPYLLGLCEQLEAHLDRMIEEYKNPPITY